MRRVDPGEKLEGERVLRHLFSGARLDSVTFRSVELTLGFFNAEADKNREQPGYVWLTTIASATIARSGGFASSAPGTQAGFHEGRTALVGQLYQLLGDSVFSATIAPDGALGLQFTDHALDVRAGEDEQDEIWSVTSDTPEPLGEHRWRVTLSNSGRLVVKQPAR